MLKFDEPDLIKKLDGLPKHLRVAFAALCAERLIPAALAFLERIEPGDRADVGSILNRLWSDIEGDEMSPQEIREHFDACLALLRDEDDGEWSSERVYGEDALAALAYALDTRLNGGSQEPATAARRVYDALYYFMDPPVGIHLGQASDVERITALPLIQGELARQLQDLDDLTTLAREPRWRGSLKALRARAAADAYHVLQVR